MKNKKIQELPIRLAICSDSNFMNEQKVAFYDEIVPIEQKTLNKAIELAIDFHLVDKNKVGAFLGNLTKYYNDHTDNICEQVLNEALLALIHEIPIEDELVDNKDIGFTHNGFASEFALSDIGKDELEEKIMNRIEEDGDIALSPTTKKVLEKMHIDVNELRRRVREKLEDEKEQQEEQEFEDMVVAKKHRQRLNKLFE